MCDLDDSVASSEGGVGELTWGPVLTSPCPLHMIQAQQPVPAVDHHPDRVEADRVGGGADVLLVGQPGGGELAQTDALAGAQPVQRLLVGSGSVWAGVDAAGLDLGKDECSAIERDQVDLAVTGALVAPQGREAQAVQVFGGELLAATTQRMARVGGPRGLACGV